MSANWFSLNSGPAVRRDGVEGRRLIWDPCPKDLKRSSIQSIWEFHRDSSLSQIEYSYLPTSLFAVSPSRRLESAMCISLTPLFVSCDNCDSCVVSSSLPSSLASCAKSKLHWRQRRIESAERAGMRVPLPPSLPLNYVPLLKRPSLGTCASWGALLSSNGNIGWERGRAKGKHACPRQ